MQLLSCQKTLFAESCSALQAVVSQLGQQSAPLALALLPLLIDHTSCATAASEIAQHAHVTVCALVRSVDAPDAIPKVRA